MATIGSALVMPEATWKRIDERESSIVYTGYGFQTQSPAWATTLTFCITAKFKFYGTKFRLLGASVADTYHNGSISVTIDGVLAGSYSQYASPVQPRLDYEKTGLLLDEHTVELTLTSTANANLHIFLDAIDIDDTGFFGITNFNKYLLKQNNRIFSFSTTSAMDIGAYSEGSLLSLFETNGNISPPTINIINSMEGPVDVLRYLYKGGTKRPSVTAMAVSLPKLILAKDDISLSSIQNINSISVNASNVPVIISVDGGVTWKTWSSSWINIDVSTPKNVADKGMPPSVISSRTVSDWADLIGVSKKIRFGYCLNTNSTSDVTNTDSVTLNINMKGMWMMAMPGIEYNYGYAESNVVNIKLFSSGDYKINY